MKFGIIGNTGKPIVSEVAGRLLAYFRARHLEYLVHDALGAWINSAAGRVLVPPKLMCTEQNLARSSDMLIALGGDGTMLMAARIVGNTGIPILGVNLGKLGFLAEVSADEIQECLEDVVAGSYLIEERVALTARASSDEKEYFALNEIVIDRGASPRVIDLETAVDGEYLVTYTADGIMVTTPTGSTAYSLASGGPIVVPQSRVLVINPISPHTLTARPVVTPDDRTVTIAILAKGRRVHITSDGQTEGFYDSPVSFTVQKSAVPVKLVKRKQRGYFDLLRTKLLWGRDLRREGHD